jgi:hypothetical protein
MNAALPLPHAPTSTAHVLDEDLSLFTVANALLACHARGADSRTMLTMCERLLTVTEHELLARERKMMASGDPHLAAHVRRHGDVLLVLTHQVRDCRRTGAPLSKGFISFVGALVGRMRAMSAEAV